MSEIIQCRTFNLEKGFDLDILNEMNHLEKKIAKILIENNIHAQLHMLKNSTDDEILEYIGAYGKDNPVIIVKLRETKYIEKLWQHGFKSINSSFTTYTDSPLLIYINNSNGKTVYNLITKK